jgi:hypothetical protein
MFHDSNLKAIIFLPFFTSVSTTDGQLGQCDAMRAQLYARGCSKSMARGEVAWLGGTTELRNRGGVAWVELGWPMGWVVNLLLSGWPEPFTRQEVE